MGLTNLQNLMAFTVCFKLRFTALKTCSWFPLIVSLSHDFCKVFNIKVTCTYSEFLPHKLFLLLSVEKRVGVNEEKSLLRPEAERMQCPSHSSAFL